MSDHSNPRKKTHASTTQVRGKGAYLCDSRTFIDVINDAAAKTKKYKAHLLHEVVRNKSGDSDEDQAYPVVSVDWGGDDR